MLAGLNLLKRFNYFHLQALLGYNMSLEPSTDLPTLHFSVTKSAFKCNNWILSMTHIFRKVNRTPTQNIICAVINDREFYTAYSTSLCYGAQE